MPADIEQVRASAEYLQDKIVNKPEVGLILGSGLGVLAEEIQSPITITYTDIPGFPTSTVSGHKGQLVFGELQGQQVVAMQGRFHFYEGYSLQTVTFPVRVLKQLGVTTLMVTNASGGVNDQFSAGDLMLIEDHINWLHGNPLIGPNPQEIGPRFPDMSAAYHKDLIHTAEEAASEMNISLQKGVYLATSGPSYETPAEVRMMREMGADAVGMSTVPEVIAANHAGMQVLGISCISNLAAGILDQPLSHDEVMASTQSVRADFLKLVKTTLYKLNHA